MQMQTQDVAIQAALQHQPAEQADHAAMAMQAARRVARARRKSQKEKMGRVVCHHLLCLLNEEAPRRPRRPLASARLVRPLVPGDNGQGSLGF